MGFINEKSVKAVRKARPCCACGSIIHLGESAVMWAGHVEEDFSVAYYHPDCRAAEIAYNAMAGLSGEDWASLAEREPDDDAWLLAEHPTVAARLGLAQPPQISSTIPHREPIGDE